MRNYKLLDNFDYFKSECDDRVFYYNFKYVNIYENFVFLKIEVCLL